MKFDLFKLFLTLNSVFPLFAISLLNKKIGFIGLGSMGTHMAGHLQSKICKSDSPLIIWNRTIKTAIEHSKQHGTLVANSLDDISTCSLLLLSLPTTNEVIEVINKCKLVPGSIVIDTTSGDPIQTKILADKLFKEKGIIFIDCPVSGGPSGAKAASLTTMIGGNDVATINEIVMPLVTQSFSKKSVYCGKSGSGMAVKSVNNALNTAHLLLATEGLLALKMFGVEPEVSLDVINSSSGRSMATQERIPQEVLSGNFNFGFKLSLMAKDCRIAGSIVADTIPNATLLPEVIRLINSAESDTLWGKNADYTEVVRVIEENAGHKLRYKNNQ